MRKTLPLFTLSIISLLLLCSCNSTPREKSEEEILEEISQIDHYIADYNLTIESYEITKRQTNPDSKTDYIWISVCAGNKDITYYNSYELEYALCNDRWLLENYCKGNESYGIVYDRRDLHDVSTSFSQDEPISIQLHNSGSPDGKIQWWHSGGFRLDR